LEQGMSNVRERERERERERLCRGLAWGLGTSPRVQPGCWWPIGTVDDSSGTRTDGGRRLPCLSHPAAWAVAERAGTWTPSPFPRPPALCSHSCSLRGPRRSVGGGQATGGRGPGASEPPNPAVSGCHLARTLLRIGKLRLGQRQSTWSPSCWRGEQCHSLSPRFQTLYGSPAPSGQNPPPQVPHFFHWGHPGFPGPWSPPQDLCTCRAPRFLPQSKGPILRSGPQARTPSSPATRPPPGPQWAS
jgi:hypothetical protein